MSQWTELINRVYENKEDHGKVRRVFESLDKRNTGYMTPEMFFQG